MRVKGSRREGEIGAFTPATYTVMFDDGRKADLPAATLASIESADPPSAPAKDALEQARIAEIRERLAKAPDDELFVKANYSQYYMVRGVHNGAVFADVPITGTFRQEIQKGYAHFIAAAPADIRFLLDRLDAVTKERDEAVTTISEITRWQVLMSTHESFYRHVREITEAFYQSHKHLFDVSDVEEPTDE